MDNQNTEKIASGVFWKFAERIISQTVSFVVSLILARLLAPEDYGAVAAVLVFIEIANVFLTSGFTTAVIQNRNANMEQLSTIFYCNVLIGSMLYLLLWLFAPTIARVYKIPILLPVTRVVALKIPISSVQAFQTAIVSRNLDFKKLFFCTISGTTASAIVGIMLAMKGFGVWALVAQILVSTTIDTLVLVVTVRWKPALCFSLKKAMPLIQYGWKVLAADLVGTIYNQLNSLIIGARYTAVDLGAYTKGKQLPQLVRGNINNSILSVMFPAMAQVGDDLAQVKELARGTVRMLCFVLMPIMFGMSAVAEELVLLLYTEKWLPMVPFLIICCSECVLSIVPAVALETLRATGRSDVMLKMEYIKKPIQIICIFGAIPFGVTAVALTLPLMTMVEFFVNGYYAKHHVGYSYAEQLADCLPSALISLVMALVVRLVALADFSLPALFVLEVMTGVVAYIALAALFKIREFYAVVHFLRSKIK